MIIYSRTSLATDTDGNLTRLTTTGPQQDSLKTYNQVQEELLTQVLEQLKVMNFQLATITENEIDEIS